MSTLRVEKEPRRIASVWYFPNGMAIVCDQLGQQMPEMGGPSLEMSGKIAAAIAAQDIKPMVRGTAFKARQMPE